MRLTRKMLSSAAAMLLAFAMPAMASPLALLQDPPVKVDVHTTESHTVWYLEPMWMVVGGLVLLLIIVLAVAAGRGERGGGTTTVIR